MDRLLIVLMGLPGSGKTTLARWWVARSGGVIASRDDIRAAMFPNCTYTVAEKQSAYEAMRLAIATNLRLNRRVCTDGMTFAGEAERADMARLADEASAALLFVHCECPLGVAQERVAQDIETVFPDRDAAAVTEVAGRFAAVPPDAVRLNMTQPPSIVGEQLLAAVAAQAARP